MKFRIDYTAGNIFDLENKNFKVMNKFALVPHMDAARASINQICLNTKASAEDFLITDLETGKRGRLRKRSH